MSSTQSPALFSRRRLLQIAGVGAIAGVTYTYRRGLRFPTLSLESAAPPSHFNYANLSAQVSELIEIPTDLMAHKPMHAFRAFAPEPTLRLSATEAKNINIGINNIATDAELMITGDTAISEEIQGINRLLTLDLKRNQQVSLSWKLPKLQDYQFASIGDSGGDKELGWCIKRAHQLGARFLLHLGDFNYQEGDYDNAVRQFHDAPLPCYVTIGNHDFHESGLIYSQFLNQLGPLSNHFNIGKTRFANIDTAANTLPYWAGHRGKLFDQIINLSSQVNDTVAFTHRPLHDPLGILKEDHEDHDIGSEGERDWLINALKRANIKSLLSGHIHIFNRSEFNGIDNIIVGQGLGHQDLLINGDNSKMAIGQINQDGMVSYTFAPLAMPMELHCHPRVDEVKRTVRQGPHAELIRFIDQQCESPT